MATSPKWGIPYIAEGQAAPEVTHNQAVNMLQMIRLGGVIDLQNGPPGSPVEGAVYIVGTVPTGAWIGHANALAGFYGGAWVFVPGVDDDGTIIPMGAAQAGLTMFNITTGANVTWDGAAWGLNTLSPVEGTFTPTMAFSVPGTSTFSYGTRAGHYQKDASWVQAFIDLTVTPTIGTGSGDVQIGGLPYPATLTFVSGQLGQNDIDITWPAGSTQLIPVTVTGQSYVLIRAVGPAGVNANIQAAALAANPVTFRLTIRYKA